MNDRIHMALIIGGSILLATAMYIYFSPFQTCTRVMTGMAFPKGNATPAGRILVTLQCVKNLRGTAL